MKIKKIARKKSPKSDRRNPILFSLGRRCFLCLFLSFWQGCELPVGAFKLSVDESKTDQATYVQKTRVSEVLQQGQAYGNGINVRYFWSAKIKLKRERYAWNF